MVKISLNLMKNLILSLLWTNHRKEYEEFQKL